MCPVQQEWQYFTSEQRFGAIGSRFFPPDGEYLQKGERGE